MNLSIRDAEEADLQALTALKGEDSEGLIRDCLRYAEEGGMRFLVLLLGQQIIGSAWLVFRRPAHWSDGDDLEHLPGIVDLRVAESLRGNGYGSAFVRAIE